MMWAKLVFGIKLSIKWLQPALLFLIVGTFVYASSALAAGEQAKININISGSVIATGECRFDDRGNLTVDFGDVRYNTLDNALEGTYSRSLGSAMTCNGDTEGASMTLKTTATPVVVGGKKLLPVTIQGLAGSQALGIQLKVNGQVQDVNTGFNFDSKNPPVLEVELVRANVSHRLKPDADISSSATLTIAFN